jgi:uncharacterized protein (DUF433 family)
MTVAVAAEPVPLIEDADGVLRVGGTRLPLDTVVIAYEAGATPEEICLDFPTLRLDDVYSVITYYLRHRSEVEAYLCRRRKEAEKVRQDNEARFDPQGLRERLRARLER